MGHYQNKTTETDRDVNAFIQSIDSEKKRKDAVTLLTLMVEISGFEPKMWGPSIIGFGSYHYKYESGHEGDAPLMGFSPRKAALTLYLSSSFPGREELLENLGKHKISKACLYINKLEDVNLDVLKEMMRRSFSFSKNSC